MIYASEVSTVYRCRRRSDETGAIKYAVKLYHRKMFARGKLGWLGDKLKYRAIKRLNHPNVVKTLDLIEHDGGRYWVMKYVDGVSVDELVKRGIPLRGEAIAKLARGAAAAFRYLEHSLSKPFIFLQPALPNILVRADGSPCVIDMEPLEPLSNDIRFYGGYLPGLRRVYRKARMNSYIRVLGKCALRAALPSAPKERSKERLTELGRQAIARGYDEDLIGLAVASVADPRAVKFADWERISA